MHRLNEMIFKTRNFVIKIQTPPPYYVSWDSLLLPRPGGGWRQWLPAGSNMEQKKKESNRISLLTFASSSVYQHLSPLLHAWLPSCPACKQSVKLGVFRLTQLSEVHGNPLVKLFGFYFPAVPTEGLCPNSGSVWETDLLSVYTSGLLTGSGSSPFPVGVLCAGLWVLLRKVFELLKCSFAVTASDLLQISYSSFCFSCSHSTFWGSASFMSLLPWLGSSASRIYSGVYLHGVSGSHGLVYLVCGLPGFQHCNKPSTSTS